MFNLDDLVELNLDHITLQGTVIKISYTKHQRWLGVRLASGIELHGIDEHLARLVHGLGGPG
jgi:hypothetical protein